MNKVEREKLREECNRLGTIYGDSVSHLSIRDTKALLDHIDALDGQLEKAEEVIRIVADPDAFPPYHSQGMGCGLEDRDITDRYEAMRYGWDSLADRVHDEVIIVAEEYLEALASAPEVK